MFLVYNVKILKVTRLVYLSVVRARGVWCMRERVGDRVESIYFQHRKPNCKAAYLFLISLALRCFESG